MITQLFCLTAISYLFWHNLFIKKLVPFKNFLNALPIVSTHIKNSDNKYTTRLEHTAKSIVYHFIKHAGMTAQRSHAITNCTWTLFRTLLKIRSSLLQCSCCSPWASLCGVFTSIHTDTRIPAPLHQNTFWSSSSSTNYFLTLLFICAYPLESASVLRGREKVIF